MSCATCSSSRSATCGSASGAGCTKGQTDRQTGGAAQRRQQHRSCRQLPHCWRLAPAVAGTAAGLQVWHLAACACAYTCMLGADGCAGAVVLVQALHARCCFHPPSKARACSLRSRAAAAAAVGQAHTRVATGQALTAQLSCLHVCRPTVSRPGLLGVLC